MGPRSEDRGNRLGQTLNGPTQGQLQWGRDLKIAEMPHPLIRPRRKRLLQWGRDLKIAEMQLGLSATTATLAASMGPRSEDRGNPRLSFGYDVLTAASMGPRSEDRGNDSIKPKPPAKAASFNGAAI